MSVGHFRVAQAVRQGSSQRIHAPGCYCSSTVDSAAASAAWPLTFTVNFSPALGRKVTRAGCRSQCGAAQSESGRSPATCLAEFLAIERLLDADLRNHRKQPLGIAGDTAIGRVVAIPAYLRIERVEIRQLELRNLSRTAVHQQPSAALPKPFGGLRGIIRERVVDAKSPANHELAIGDVVRLAGGELLQLANPRTAAAP